MVSYKHWKAGEAHRAKESPGLPGAPGERTKFVAKLKLSYGKNRQIPNRGNEN